MSRIIETTVYKYSELSPEAQEKARDWLREANQGDNYFSESVTDDFKEVLKAAGFDLERRNRHDALYWSGFWSQGDGACFSAHWSARDTKELAALIADRPVTYQRDGVMCECKHNARIVPILNRVAALVAKYPDATGSIVGNDRYHSTRCESADLGTLPDTDEARDDHADDEETLRAELEDIAQDLAAFFYFALESEYDYQNSDEQIAESIEANEYEFLESGRRA